MRQSLKLFQKNFKRATNQMNNIFIIDFILIHELSLKLHHNLDLAYTQFNVVIK